MNQKNNTQIKIILKSIFILAIFGFSVQALADWAVPTAVPPLNNPPPPINTGLSTQDKAGYLRLNGLKNFSATVLDTSLDVAGQVIFTGPFRITSGTLGAGRVLTSDANGNATWQVASGSAVWGGITGTLSNQTDLQTALNAKQNLLVNSAGLAGALSDETGTGLAVFSISPALTGIPTAPTAAAGTSTTQLATTAFVTNAVSGAGGISGTPSRLPMFNASGNSLTDSVAFQSALGNIGINTTNPGARLAVLGNLNVGTNFANVAGQANGAIIEGSVGIGTNNPLTKLHVIGSVMIVDGTQENGKILSSNAFGLASWKTPGELGIGGSSGPWTRTGTVTHLTNLGDSVGIGTTSPSQQLQITGNFAFGSDDAGIIYKGGRRFLHNAPSKVKENLFLGADSGNLSLSGDRNTGIGDTALLNISTGGDNTGVGQNSMYSLSSGGNNTAMGSKSLFQVVSGSNNVAIGFQAMGGGPGTNLGRSHNVAVGSGSLQTNTGSNNVGVGSNALSGASSGNGSSLSTALGYNAGSSASGQPLGQGNVYIGASSCGQVTGSPLCVSSASWSDNTLLGRNSATKVASTSTVITNATAVGYDAQVDASNKVRIGNSAVTWIGGQVAWTNASDARLKKNITDLDLGLNFINNLRPVSYQMNNDTDSDLSFGFIAQEVEQALGDKKAKLISTQNDADSMKYMRYDDLIAPMVKAIQEQQTQIETLQKEIEILKNK